jgi:hypothetical protein
MAADAHVIVALDYALEQEGILLTSSVMYIKRHWSLINEDTKGYILTKLETFRNSWELIITEQELNNMFTGESTSVSSATVSAAKLWIDFYQNHRDKITIPNPHHD